MDHDEAGGGDVTLWVMLAGGLVLLVALGAAVWLFGFSFVEHAEPTGAPAVIEEVKPGGAHEHREDFGWDDPPKPAPPAPK